MNPLIIVFLPLYENFLKYNKVKRTKDAPKRINSNIKGVVSANPVLITAKVPPQIIVTNTRKISALIRFLSIRGKYHREAPSASEGGETGDGRREDF